MGNVENIDFRGSNVNLLRQTTFVEHINALAWLGLCDSSRYFINSRFCKIGGMEETEQTLEKERKENLADI